MELLEKIGLFLDSPPPGAVVSFCWVFSSLFTFVIVQRIKRLSALAGHELSNLGLEITSVYVSWTANMLIMVGLYYLPWRESSIHAILIAGIYTSAISWWMSWTKKNRPDVYQALRTNRRATDDTTEFTIPPS